jgi:spore coat protein H
LQIPARVRTAIVAAGAAVALGACGGPPISTTSDPPQKQKVLPQPAWPALQQGPLEPIAIDYPPEEEAQLLDPANELELPARWRIHGAWYDVGLRMRGQGSRFHPKHSWKVKLPKGVTVDGRRDREYLAEYLDGGYLSDPFSYALMLGATGTSPDSRLVTLDVNGAHQGVYVELEHVDKQFLAAHGLAEGSSIYRCGARDCEMTLWPLESYQYPWEKKTNEAEPWDDLNRFLRELNRTPEHELAGWLASRLDLDRFVRFYAVAILISWSGVDDSGSYLVHDHAADRWTFVPWDLNNAQLTFWYGVGAGASPSVRYAIPTYTLYDPATIGVAAGKSERYGVAAHPPYVVLFQRVWDLPDLRNRILDEVEAMLDGVFSPAQANPRIEALHALVASALGVDPWMDETRLAYHAASADYLKRYVAGRAAFLRASIPAERRRGEGGLLVNAIGPGFVELYNAGSAPRSLAGLTITPNLRHRADAPAAPLPDVAVAPGAKVSVPFATSEGGGEVGVFDAATLEPLDARFYAPLAGRTYARRPDGAAAWGWR